MNDLRILAADALPAQRIITQIFHRELLTMPGILDLDLNSITDPNDPATPGTYRLVIIAAEKHVKEETGSIGVNYQYRILTPGENQGKGMFEYVNVVDKSGKVNKFGAWQVKQFAALKGIKKGTLGELIDKLPAQLGAEFDAEVDIEEQEGFNPKNRIKRILK